VTEESFDEPRNARRIAIVFDVCDVVILEVTGNLIDPIVGYGPGSGPTIETEAPAWQTISFCLESKPDGCGMTAIGYRAEWDITDPDDDDAWGMPFTPFPTPVVCLPPRVFTGGSHLFIAEAVDISGFLVRVSVLVHIAAPTPVEPTTWGRIKALYGE
jgi:hypothetical protein